MSKLRSYGWGLGLVLLLSEAVLAMPGPIGETLAQQVETGSPEEIRAAAEHFDMEGMELFQQGTAESFQQAIEKWEIALPLWR